MPQTKTISTIQAKQVLDSTHYLLVSSQPCKIQNIEGNVNSTTGTSYYIQLLGTGAPSSGTTIPLYSRLCVASGQASGINGFSFLYGTNGIDTSTLLHPFGGTLATAGQNALAVYVAISSTDTVYTAVAASTNVSIDIDEYGLEAVNQTVTGDTTTAVASLAVWTDSSTNSGKRMITLIATDSVGASATSGTVTVGVYYEIVTFVAGDDFTNIGGTNTSGNIFKATGTTPTTWSNGSTVATVSFLMLFTAATPASTATAIQQWPFYYGQTRTLSFGTDEPIMSQGADGTIHYGCYFYGSTVPGPGAFTATAANWTIEAFNV